MKKLLIVCVLLFSMITLAQAQSGGHKKMASPEARAKMSAERLSKRLDLNKDQRTRIEDIYLNEEMAMATARKENMNDNTAKMAEMKRIHGEAEEKITNELTEPQKQKYEAWKMENKGHMKKHMKKGMKEKKPATTTPAM
ncbi:MAG: hypothetical protein P0Y49_16165 [Candidatus Pedobacter colombiensis]|uniref:DUF4890 domain-containing protein n=1 Tax=Candidatus Pedobacter colombiensis TaxID=3121371 RepID=A0AAJ5W8A4_9SPHI|nr:hypothetical protein [Pedobacter sp.]WEK18327.1 MAG: hypothetical protein P0Y49_16165 [Pedobacter sp.]